MAKFIREAAEVEAVRSRAVQFDGVDLDGDPFDGNVPNWLLEAMRTGKMKPQRGSGPRQGRKSPVAWQLPGGRIAAGGDWIIRDEHGELTSLNPHTFAASYRKPA